MNPSLPKTIVIKLGGHALDRSELLDAFIADVKILLNGNFKIVIIHGGGPHINNLLKRLALKSNFIDGLRVTDDATMEVVEMALCAKVNKELTRHMLKKGIKAAGVSGQDCSTLLATRAAPELGKVGNVSTVNLDLINALLNEGITPMIAPVALDNMGESINVNADIAAGAIAGAMGADYFVLLSDVPGVLDEDGNLMERLNAAEIAGMKSNGIISGGMIPKTDCCLSAIAAGCKKALIIDGRMENALSRYIGNGEIIGTAIEG